MVGEMSGRANVQLRKCCNGKMSSWGSVGQGSVWAGKCPVGEVSVEDVSFGEVSVGELFSRGIVRVL